MEQDSIRIVLKGLAIALIAVLGINVYRTEKISEKLDEFAPSALLDTSAGTKPVSGESSGTELTQEIARLQSIVEDQQQQINALKSSISKITSDSGRQDRRTSEGKSESVDNTPVRDDNAGTASEKYGRVKIGVIVRVENRYVDGKTELPNITSGPEGKVVVKVNVNNIGSVGSVSIDPETNIKDEAILEECKQAALKTNFGLNTSAPTNSPGTITYTFTAR